MAASGPRSKLLCAPQEAAPVCTVQCSFPKRVANAAIGRSLCVTSIPSDTSQPFILSRFFSLPRPSLGRPSIAQICSWSSGRRLKLNASLTKRLTLLHQISKIGPPHHLPQGTLLNMVFPTPPTGKKKFPLSVIRGWRLMMT